MTPKYLRHKGELKKVLLVCPTCEKPEWDVEHPSDPLVAPSVGDVGLCANCMGWWEIGPDGSARHYDPTPDEVEYCMTHLPDQLKKRGRL